MGIQNLLLRLSAPFMPAMAREDGWKNVAEYVFSWIASPHKRQLLRDLSEDLKSERHGRGIRAYLEENSDGWALIKRAGRDFGRDYGSELDLHIRAADICRGFHQESDDPGDGWRRGLLRDLLSYFKTGKVREAENNSTYRIPFAVVPISPSCNNQGHLFLFELEKVGNGNGAVYPALEQAFAPMDNVFKAGLEEVAGLALGMKYDVRFRIRNFANGSLFQWEDYKLPLSGRSATGAFAYGLHSLLNDWPDRDGEGLIYLAEWEMEGHRLVPIAAELLLPKLEAILAVPDLEVVLSASQSFGPGAGISGYTGIHGSFCENRHRGGFCEKRHIHRI